MRIAMVAVTILLALTANASWLPEFSASYVQLHPGESTTVTARAIWTGLVPVSFTPMRFVALDPTVATVDGYLPTTASVAVHVTAIAPGVTRIGLEGGSVPFTTSPIIAVAERELAVRIEVVGPPVPGAAVTLRASTDDRQAVFTWYDGSPTRSWMWRMADGAEFTFVPSAPIVYEYWVLATSPDGAGTATIALDIRQSTRRERSVRH